MAVDPAANAGFLIAAYAVTGVILLGYGAVLLVRARRPPRR